MSAAFPEVQLPYKNVSPQLAVGIKENINFLLKLNKLMTEVMQRFSTIHEECANHLFTMVDTYNKKLGEMVKAKNKYDFQSDTFIKFFERLLEQYEIQGKSLQAMSKSFTDSIIKPMNKMVDERKHLLKMCFHYVESFNEQIEKKEVDLCKRYKDYSEAATKAAKHTFPRSDKSTCKKQMRLYHNAHNTYLLRLSSVNSINRLLYSHVLPHVVYGLQHTQTQMNNSIRHNLKYFFSVQKESLKKTLKSVDKIDHATEKLDVVSDLHKFIKSTSKDKINDKACRVQEFLPPANENKRTSIALPNIEASFILDRYTQPNLQRRLASLQYQTSQLVESIAAIRSGESDEMRTIMHSDDPNIKHINELLYICDKEANLNVLLKQMELYTPHVLKYIGPLPENVLDERQTVSNSTKTNQATNSNSANKAHEFILPKMMKPTQCYYCDKIVTFIGKSFMCKSCKMCVHKKCATNVPFCDGTPVNLKVQSKFYSGSQDANGNVSIESSTVYDLIDFESDDDYYDDDEFDDGLSDDEGDNYVNDSTSRNFVDMLINLEDNGNKPKVFTAKPTAKPPTFDRINKPNHSSTKSKDLLGRANSNFDLNSVLKPTLASKPQISKKPIIAKKPIIPSKPPAIPSRGEEEFCVAFHDYISSEDGYLSITAGDKIKIKDKTSSEWWLGILSGVEGYLPVTYVKEILTNQKILRCLYDFKAEHDQEITVYENEILVLLEEDGDWLEIQSYNGKGLVPASYIEYI